MTQEERNPEEETAEEGTDPEDVPEEANSTLYRRRFAVEKSERGTERVKPQSSLEAASSS